MPQSDAPSAHGVPPISADLCRVMNNLGLGLAPSDKKKTEPPGAEVSTEMIDTRRYQVFVQQANSAGRSNDTILTAIIAQIMMANWSPAIIAMHEQRLRAIREQHRAMLRHNTPLANGICDAIEVMKEDIAQFSADSSLSANQKVARIQGFIQRIQFFSFFVQLTRAQIYLTFVDLFEAWSRLPPVFWSSGLETEMSEEAKGSIDKEIETLRKMPGYAEEDENSDLLDLLPHQGGRQPTDPINIVNFYQRTEILARVWSWVLVDEKQIVSWFEMAKSLVDLPHHMQHCLEDGMKIYAEKGFYLRQYSDGMAHWLDWP